MFPIDNHDDNVPHPAQPTIINPYANISNKTGSKRNSSCQERKSALDLMMDASREQGRKKKKKKVRNEPTDARTDARSNIAKARAAARQHQPTNPDLALPSNNSSGDWQSHTWEVFQTILTLIKNKVNFNPRGLHELQGEWPLLAYGTISPSADPLNFCRMLRQLAGDNESLDTFRIVKKEDFSVPDLILWAPELRWPLLYPDGRPKCPFHHQTSCVHHLGTAPYVRRCYGAHGNVGLAKRRYKCKIHEDQGKKPYCFDSTSKDVLNLAPEYVKGYWMEHGFFLSHKGGVSWRVINQLRALVANGSGVSGFQKSLTEAYKRTYWDRCKMWRNYSCICYEQSLRPEHKKRSTFFDFDAPESELKVPSLSYLIEMLVRNIESRILHIENTNGWCKVPFRGPQSQGGKGCFDTERKRLRRCVHSNE